MSHVRATLGDALSQLDGNDPVVRSGIAPPSRRLHRRQGGVVGRQRGGDPGDAAGAADAGPAHPARVRGHDPAGPARDGRRCSRRAIELAGVTAADLSAVVLAGGSSRIPLVAEMVSSALGRPVAVDAHPKHTVALGAARASPPGRGTPPSPRHRDRRRRRARRPRQRDQRPSRHRPSNSPLRPSPRRSNLGRSRRSRRGRPVRPPSASRRSGRPPGAAGSSSRSPRRSCSSPQVSARSCSSAAVKTAVHRRTPRSRRATRPSSRTPPTRPAPRKRRTRTHRRNPTSQRRPSRPYTAARPSTDGACSSTASSEKATRSWCATRPPATNRNWTPRIRTSTCTSTSTRCQWTRPASTRRPSNWVAYDTDDNGEEIYRFAAATIPPGATKLCASVANINHGLDDLLQDCKALP